jgi:hypothetical protein
MVRLLQAAVVEDADAEAEVEGGSAAAWGLTSRLDASSLFRYVE